MSWQKKARQVQRELANTFEIPTDIMLDLPKIVMVGNLQVQIENHKGIIVYQPDVIICKITDGQLSINGENLTVKNIGMEHIHIEGRIKDIKFNLAEEGRKK